MKILFMGTPNFAAVVLSALAKSEHEIVGVVTQPDTALKHGKTEPSAVKRVAAQFGIKVFQPNKIRDEIDALKQFGADIAVTAAYGQILTQSVLDVFDRGVINVHASLLPLYRGASPISSVIADGGEKTGVTIMQTECGIDTGDILSFVETPIGKDETAGELTARLADLGAALLIDTLSKFDSITPVKQDNEKATHCRMIKKSAHYIDFDRDCREVVDQIRALSPLPCAKTVINGETYKIYRAKAAENAGSGKAGEIVECGDRLIISCATGAIEILTIQAPSKRALEISEFLRGRKLPIGAVCAKP